jgi:quercetin dioxygenase-like cupin family protein
MSLETVSIPGNTFTILEDGEATAGRIGVVECELAPGWAGPPQHTHRQHDETFYVLEGEVRFSTGEKTFVLVAGESTTIPIGTSHTFENASAEMPARVLGTVSPARYIKYFRELGALPLDADGRLDAATLRGLMGEYDTEPSVSPRP